MMTADLSPAVSLPIEAPASLPVEAPASPASPASEAPLSSRSSSWLSRADDGLPAIEVRAGLVSAGVLATALVWAALTPADPSVRADGVIVPHGRTQVVQHLEGGVVSDILVHEGDHVKAGDVLLRVSPAPSSARLGEGKSKIASLRAKAARLEAEGSDREPVFPADLKDTAPEAIASEAASFAAGAEEFKRSTANFTEQRAALQVELGAAQEQEALQSKLGEAGRKADLLNARQSVARIRAQVAAASGSLDDLRSKRRAEALRQLSAVRADLSALAPGLASDEDRASRTDLRSSVEGVVKTLKVTTIGGVVSPGETVAEVTPTGTEMLVEAHVRPERIGAVAVGKPAIVRVEAWDFTRYGVLDGTVVDVSSDAIEDPRRPDARYYRVVVRTSSDHLPYRYEGEREPTLSPGMPVDVDLRSGEQRSLLSRLLSPVFRTARLSTSGR